MKKCHSVQIVSFAIHLEVLGIVESVSFAIQLVLPVIPLADIFFGFLSQETQSLPINAFRQ